jgi:hypothetical protein
MKLHALVSSVKEHTERRREQRVKNLQGYQLAGWLSRLKKRASAVAAKFGL